MAEVVGACSHAAPQCTLLILLPIDGGNDRRLWSCCAALHAIDISADAYISYLFQFQTKVVKIRGGNNCGRWVSRVCHCTGDIKLGRYSN